MQFLNSPGSPPMQLYTDSAL